MYLNNYLTLCNRIQYNSNLNGMLKNMVIQFYYFGYEKLKILWKPLVLSNYSSLKIYGKHNNDLIRIKIKKIWEQLLATKCSSPKIIPYMWINFLTFENLSELKTIFLFYREFRLNDQNGINKYSEALRFLCVSIRWEIPYYNSLFL